MERMTADANYLLHELHVHYLSRVQNGEAKSDTKLFYSASYIQELIHSSMPIGDIDAAMRELGSIGYLKNDYGDELIQCCCLEDKAIIDCELETKDKASSAINKATSIANSVASIVSAFKTP